MALTEVRHLPEHERFEIHLDGTLAGVVTYGRVGKKFALTHTKVFPEFEGHGVGTQLVVEVLREIRELGGCAIPVCPFIPKVIRDHPEFVDLVPEDSRPQYGLV